MGEKEEGGKISEEKKIDKEWIKRNISYEILLNMRKIYA